MDLKVIPIVAVAVLVVGLVFHIVGLATPAWNTFGDGYKGERGLWEFCFNDNCQDLVGIDDYLKACRAMAILGMIAAMVAVGVAITVVILNLMKKEPNKIFGILTIAAAGLSFAMIIICVIIYAVKSKEGNSSYDFGYSFALSITGAILIMIGGCLAFWGTQ